MITRRSDVASQTGKFAIIGASVAIILSDIAASFFGLPALARWIFIGISALFSGAGGLWTGYKKLKENQREREEIEQYRQASSQLVDALDAQQQRRKHRARARTQVNALNDKTTRKQIKSPTERTYRFVKAANKAKESGKMFRWFKSLFRSQSHNYSPAISPSSLPAGAQPTPFGGLDKKVIQKRRNSLAVRPSSNDSEIESEVESKLESKNDLHYQPTEPPTHPTVHHSSLFSPTRSCSTPSLLTPTSSPPSVARSASIPSVSTPPLILSPSPSLPANLPGSRDRTAELKANAAVAKKKKSDFETWEEFRQRFPRRPRA